MKTIKIETTLPIFTGFYKTIFEPDQAIQNQIEELERSIIDLNVANIEWDWDDYENRVAQACVEAVEQELNYLLFDFPLKIKYEKTGNFRNDVIFVTIEMNEETFKFMKEITKVNPNGWAEHLKEQSDFKTTYGHNPKVWEEKYLQPDYEDLGTLLPTLLDFFLMEQDYDQHSLYAQVANKCSYIDYKFKYEEQH